MVGIVNPVAAILSCAMMLRYSLNLPKEAIAIEDAVRKVLDLGVATSDIGGTATTSEVGDKIAEVLAEILKA
jgi:3-isopropylmalate dehydrogenase